MKRFLIICLVACGMLAMTTREASAYGWGSGGFQVSGGIGLSIGIGGYFSAGATHSHPYSGYHHHWGHHHGYYGYGCDYAVPHYGHYAPTNGVYYGAPAALGSGAYAPSSGYAPSYWYGW